MQQSLSTYGRNPPKVTVNARNFGIIGVNSI